VAGYSYDGKASGTRMVLEALCEHFGIAREWDPAPLMPPPKNPRLDLPAGVGVEEALGRAVHAAYDIEQDDRRLREMLRRPAEERPAYFTSLRQNYRPRRTPRSTMPCGPSASPSRRRTVSRRRHAGGETATSRHFRAHLRKGTP